MSETVFPHGRNLRIKVLGQGPMWEETVKLLRDQWQHLVGKPPYDLLILANYPHYLPKVDYETAALGALCFHPSLLPRHRGLDAVWWTLELGERETGATWFWVNERLDAGDIAIQRACVIPEGVSAGRLYYSTLVPLGVQLLAELLPVLTRGEKPATPQDEGRATYEPARPRAGEEASHA